MQKHKDSAGRYLPHARPKYREKVKLHDLDFKRLEFLYRHGPLTTEYLTFGGNEASTSKRMKELHRAHLVERPRGQFDEEENTRGNTVFHAISSEGCDLLAEELNELPPDLSDNNWFKHQALVAAVTAGFELSGIEYHPQHEILAKTGRASRAVEIDGKELIPDGIFAIKSGEKYYVIFLEADRGTEPLRNPQTAAHHRKTWEGTLQLYDELIGNKKYQDIFELEAIPVLMNATTGFDRMKNMMKVTEEMYPEGVDWIVNWAFPQYGKRFRPKGILPIREIEWQRNGYKPRRF